VRRVHVRIDGRVQGVFFRASCAEEARRLGVAGWVRNDRRGGVEAVFEGAGPAVAEMVAWCRLGPPLASVHHVDERDEPPTGETGFRIVA
jgi:acylphosphatase